MKGFTNNFDDSEIINGILANVNPPNGEPHSTTAEGLAKASEEFMEENGEEFLKALKHLYNRMDEDTVSLPQSAAKKLNDNFWDLV